MSVVCHGALNRCVREYKLTKPSEILDKTREIVLNTFEKSEEQVKDGMDIALIALHKDSNTMQFAGANNPLYHLPRDAREIQIIKGNKQPIGYSTHPRPFSNHELKLNTGDHVYLFTDGYADQFGGDKDKKMGYRQFRDILWEYSPLPPLGQKQHLTTYFKQWKAGREQIDDVCVFGLKF